MKMRGNYTVPVDFIQLGLMHSYFNIALAIIRNYEKYKKAVIEDELKQKLAKENFEFQKITIQEVEG